MAGVLMVSAGKETFKAAGAAHPSFRIKEDAEKLTIPYICLFSS